METSTTTAADRGDTTDAVGTEDSLETTKAPVDGPLRINWEQRFDTEINHIPVVTDDTVGVVTKTEKAPLMTTLGTEDGSSQSQFELPGWLWSDTIWLDGNTLVGCSRNSLYIQDWRTGEILRETLPEGTPYGLVVTQETVYVSFHTSQYSNDGMRQYGKLQAYDLSDLSTRWAIETDATVDTRPLVTADRVFLTTSENKEGGTLYAYDRETLKNLWSRKMPTAFDTGPILDDGILFAGTSGNYNNSAPPTELVALDPGDGSVVWERTDDETLAVNGRLYVVDGDLIVQSHLGVERINRSDGSTAWRNETNYNIPSGIHIQEDGVYFGTTQGNLHAIEAANGEERWQYRTGGLVSSLVIDSEMIYWTRGPNLLRATIVQQ